MGYGEPPSSDQLRFKLRFDHQPPWWGWLRPLLKVKCGATGNKWWAMVGLNAHDNVRDYTHVHVVNLGLNTLLAVVGPCTLLTSRLFEQ